MTSYHFKTNTHMAIDIKTFEFTSSNTGSIDSVTIDGVKYPVENSTQIESGETYRVVTDGRVAYVGPVQQVETIKDISPLRQLRERIHQGNVVKGFWDKERNFGELLMLVTSELSEALEAHRSGKLANRSKYLNDVMHAPAFHEKAIERKAFEEHIKNSVEDEIADAVIRLLDMATGLNIDLEWHIMAKLEYNKGREHKHGKAY